MELAENRVPPIGTRGDDDDGLNIFSG